MSEQKKFSTILITNIAFVVAVIFWSGFSYSEVNENTKDVIDVRSELEKLEERYYQDILYIRENMVTKQNLREMGHFLRNQNNE